MVHTSGWELCGSTAMSGLSEEPGRRYSGGAPSWLVDSVFVLLKERFKLFPFGKLESAPVTKKKNKTKKSLWFRWCFSVFVFPFSVSAQCVCTLCLCMRDCLQYARWAPFSQCILGSRCSQQVQDTSQMEPGWAGSVGLWKVMHWLTQTLDCVYDLL